MSAASGRERVVQPYDPRGVLCLALVWGVAIRIAVFPLFGYVDQTLATQLPAVTVVLLLQILALALAAVGPLMLARVTARLRLQLACAGLVVLGVYATELSIRFMDSLGDGSLLGWLSVGVGDLLRMVVATVVAWAVAIGVQDLYRTVRSRPIEQTVPPRLCYVCGYEKGDLDPCPECGVLHIDAEQRGAKLDNAWMGLQHSGRKLLLCVLIVFAAYSSWRIATEYVPTRRFMARFSDGYRAVYAHVDAEHSRRPGSAIDVSSIGRARELPDGTGRMIMVSYKARVPRHLPVMQVRLCAAGGPPPGWPLRVLDWKDWGTPGTVVADLNREQAERVIREGLPQGLIDAIIATADEVGWKPSGGISSSHSRRIEVRAAPYFLNPLADEGGSQR